MKCEKISEFIEAEYIQHYLEILGTKLVYKDEFHVSMNSKNIGIWVLRLSCHSPYHADA